MNETKITIKLSGKLEIGYYEGEEGKEIRNRRMIVIDGEPLDEALRLLDDEEVVITIKKGEPGE